MDCHSPGGSIDPVAANAVLAIAHAVTTQQTIAFAPTSFTPLLSDAEEQHTTNHLSGEFAETSQIGNGRELGCHSLLDST